MKLIAFRLCLLAVVQVVSGVRAAGGVRLGSARSFWRFFALRFRGILFGPETFLGWRMNALGTRRPSER
jgi:hypothetical protein